MRWSAVIGLLLLGGCGTHRECARYVAGMRSAFERYDTNKDGRIDRQEYRDVINKLPRLGEGAVRYGADDPVQTDRDFDNLDRDHNGYVSFEDFAGDQCGNGG
jgi:hypothetical protein